MRKMTDAQIRAQKRYDEKNREERNYTKQKSTAKTFIRKSVKKGRIEDLLELKSMIDNKLKEMEIMKYENLQIVHYDAAGDVYDLEFHVNGEKEFITVDASDHPEAATDEYYFDDREVVEKIIAEN